MLLNCVLYSKNPPRPLLHNSTQDCVAGFHIGRLEGVYNGGTLLVTTDLLTHIGQNHNQALEPVLQPCVKWNVRVDLDICQNGRFCCTAVRMFGPTWCTRKAMVTVSHGNVTWRCQCSALLQCSSILQGIRRTSHLHGTIRNIFYYLGACYRAFQIFDDKIIMKH